MKILSWRHIWFEPAGTQKSQKIKKFSQKIKFAYLALLWCKNQCNSTPNRFFTCKSKNGRRSMSKKLTKKNDVDLHQVQNELFSLFTKNTMTILWCYFLLKTLLFGCNFFQRNSMCKVYNVVKQVLKMIKIHSSKFWWNHKSKKSLFPQSGHFDRCD